jgi:hypothetical protein
MSINPYESPRLFPDEPPPAIPKIRRAPKPVPVSDTASIIVVSLAGIVGGTLFLGLMELSNSSFGSDSFQVSLIASVAATFSVLVYADWRIQQRRLDFLAWIAAAIGMLLASPVAYALAFGMGLVTYDLGAKNVPGAAVMGVLTFETFFFVLSVGGWWAICRMR